MQARVLYTNGDKTLALYRITHTGTDVFHSWDEFMKGTYHRSGQYHMKSRDGQYIEGPAFHLPLHEFRGAFLLDTFSFYNTQRWFDSEPYGPRDYRPGKEYDAILTIDSRTIERNAGVSLTIGLLEPHQYELLGRIADSERYLVPGNSQRQLLLDVSVSPWIWVKVDTEIQPTSKLDDEMALTVVQMWQAHAITEELLKIIPW